MTKITKKFNFKRHNINYRSFWRLQITDNQIFMYIYNIAFGSKKNESLNKTLIYV